MLVHDRGVRRLEETRPAAAGIEFGAGLKQRRAAARASEDAFALEVGVRAGERALGALLPQDTELFRREVRAPLVFGLGDLGHCCLPYRLPIYGSMGRYVGSD